METFDAVEANKSKFLGRVLVVACALAAATVLYSLFARVTVGLFAIFPLLGIAAWRSQQVGKSLKGYWSLAKQTGSVDLALGILPGMGVFGPLWKDRSGRLIIKNGEVHIYTMENAHCFDVRTVTINRPTLLRTSFELRSGDASFNVTLFPRFDIGVLVAGIANQELADVLQQALKPQGAKWGNSQGTRTSNPGSTPAGWYRDPNGQMRWWDGRDWTAQTE